MDLTPNVYSAKEILLMDFPDTGWLIHPVLRPGGDWLIAGDADSYKSLFLCQLLIHASLGMDYLWFKVTNPLRILYINTDDNIRMIQDRLKRLNTTGKPLDDNFLFIAQPYMKMDHSGCQMIQEWILNYKPDIIVFDNLTELVCGGTIDHNGMQDYIMIKNWINSQDIGVASVAHITRDTKDNKDQDKLRRIAGIGLIKAGHGIITYHENLRDSPSQRHPRFHWTLARNKNFTNVERLQYQSIITVEEAMDGLSYLREDLDD